MSYTLRRALAEVIGTAQFFGDSMRPTWPEYHYEFVRFCLRPEIVSEKELQEMVRKRLLSWGREMYRWHVQARKTRWADQVPCPSALAFAIHEGELTCREISKIKFDHGDTAKTFGLELIKDLVSVTTTQLLQPERRKRPEFSVVK